MPQSSLWPPSSHSSQPGGSELDSGPFVRRCRRAGHSTDARPLRIAVSPMSKRAARSRSMQAIAVAALSIWCAPTSAGAGQVEREQIAFVAETRLLRDHLPLAAHAEQGRRELRRLGLDDLRTDLPLTADHRRRRALHDAGLLPGDAFELVAEKARMVVTDRRDGRQNGLDHVGAVEAAAHADLDDAELGRHAREGQERERGGDVEEGDRRVAVGLLALGQQLVEHVVLDQLAGDADALVEAHEMRRGIDVDAIARGFGHGAQIGNERALAVGAGDMDQRRQFLFRRSKALQQPLDALQSEGDDPGMVAHQTLNDRIVRGHVSDPFSVKSRPRAGGFRRRADP